jgi:heat shock protein HslJ
MRASGVRLAAVCLVTAVLALTSCDDSEPRVDVGGLAQAPADLSQLEGGAWVADNVVDPDVSLVPGTQIEMRFQSDTLSANAGCNTLAGGASLNGDELVASALASTKKACDDTLGQQDAWLSDFLGSRPTIEVLDHDLWLSQRDDTVIHLTQE